MDISTDKPKVRRNHSIGSVYKTVFLRGDFLNAVDGLNDYEFSEFQRKTLNARLPDFNADRVIVLGEEFGNKADFVDLFFHIEDEMTDFHSSKYRKLSAFDQYRLVKIKNRGRFMAFSDFAVHPNFNPDQKMNAVFAEMGVSDGISACFGVPFHKNKAIYMSYILQGGKTMSSLVSRWELEYMSLPFLIGWLHRMDLIDQTTFQNWLSAIENLTPMQVFLIRDIVNLDAYKTEEAAAKFEISKRTIDAHVQSIFENKMQSQEEEANGPLSRHSSRLRDIASHFRFMMFAHQVRIGAPIA